MENDTRGLVPREEAALAFADSRQKLLAVLEDDHLNMEALSDLEIFELFWATELFPIYSQKSPHTKRAYKQDLDYILRFFVTKTQGVKQLTILNLHEYLKDVHDQYAPRTVKRRNAMLRRFLRFLHINDYHARDLSLQVKDQMKPEPLRREIDFDEMEEIALAFRHTVKQKKNRELLQLRNETMGYLLLTTGMRASELLALQFNQVHETSYMNYLEIKGKRDKWRRIPLSKKSLYLINRLKTLMQIEDINNPHICFNLQSKNDSISYEALRLIAQSASIRLTSQVNSPHWYRRSFITKLLAEGVSLFEVMNLSGHESISTTNNYLQTLKEKTNINLPFE
ncbi:tyrosine-type recombinase/integrase (plasmid) [Exiguobacterium sp. Helios]|uniref:tyrosine-type recombinase/integrase n=1 Tax=Exiguobacterium sp. Helios TaxID=2735868 RepID=UPI00165DF7D2|nr:tyrosine-type recombinase/integrase [Exiguobacterium sp. Helios]QNR22482.1 tyrosine-type recombinase/integrase [Exiguobacterium sp. Helios]